MNQSPLHIGIIGAGDNTRKRHIPGLQAITGVEIQAICNRSVESSQKVCNQFSVPTATDDPYALVDDPKLDAIVIGTWPYKHADYTIAALEAGKHVLCEARMAMNADEAARMLEASRQHPHLVAQIVPAPFSLHYDDLVRDLVAQKIGKLLSVRIKTHAESFPDMDAEKTWRRDRSLSGNNIMMIGIFYETVMRWVGPVRSLYAQTDIVVPTGDIPDHVEILGRCHRDNASFIHSATAVAGAFDAGNIIWIHGTQGVIKVDVNAGRVHHAAVGDKEMKACDLASLNKPGWRVEEEFVDAIRGIAPIRRTDFETGLAYMQFTDAIHQSADTGRRIDLPA